MTAQERAAQIVAELRESDDRSGPVSASRDERYERIIARAIREAEDAAVEPYREALVGIKAEIERGKGIRCTCCCNGNDIPEEELCRACWRIWVGGKMYLLWDFEETERRIRRALKGGES